MRDAIDSACADLVSSEITDLVWPKVVPPNTAAALALMFQLEHTQWWPADVLASHQLKQLQLLLDHAVRTVPHYRGTIRKAPEPLTWEAWRDLPILKRTEVQSAGQALTSAASPQSHGRLFLVQSSGSTGRPVKVPKTELCSLFWRAFSLRDHLWNRRAMSGKLAVVRHNVSEDSAAPDGSRSANWGQASGGVYHTGPCVLLRSSTDVGAQADWLVRQDPDYLLTYPSNLHGLARHFVKHKLKLPKLRQVRTFGEALGEGVRKACRAAWDVPLADMYSSEEAGYIALQCPQTEHYHAVSEGILVEVLDEDGTPCKTGEMGRVIVTPLHNFAMPLIRYELGDYAEVGEPCPCGRGLPVLSRICGRTRNLLRLPGGRLLRPPLGITDYAKVAPVQQAQLIQHSLEEVEAKLVVETRPSTSQESALTSIIQERLGHPFRVKFTYHNELTRSPRDKFEDFVSRITDDPQDV